jgi:hypothetical protein
VLPSVLPQVLPLQNSNLKHKFFDAGVVGGLSNHHLSFAITNLAQLSLTMILSEFSNNIKNLNLFYVQNEKNLLVINTSR